ncbi:MAG: hypothetical protein J0H98_06290 [Solirubrobacterales bacterium]|nr:hypothetical protein [Solirubrobacterales bacterium]
MDVPTDGEVEIDKSNRVVSASAEETAGNVFRGRLVETRADQVIVSTATTIETDAGAWFWFDLSRSAENAWDRPWTPIAPGMVSQVLEGFTCSRGDAGLDENYHQVNGAQGRLLAEQVTNAARDVPFVVLSPTRGELEDGIGPTLERAHEVQRRLAGVSPVYVLGPGSVSSFSKGMLELVGPAMDVHSGATRIYLPGVGADRDWVRRHRVVPLDRFLRKRAPFRVLADFVADSVLRGASHQNPPQPWENFRKLPQFSGGSASDETWDEIAEDYERQLETVEDLKLEIEGFREESIELLLERDDLLRRIYYLEKQVRTSGGNTEAAQEDAPASEPDQCADVVTQVEEETDRIKFGDTALEGAKELDEHSEPSWAKKALRAFRALDAYVARKEEGFEGDFQAFCESGDLSAIPRGWVSLHESGTTDQNARYRELRTFEVPTDVDKSGRAYMDAHIKIERGGYPCPRIHFHDDTQGTGRVYVGWFGPHLDSKSKN